MHPDLQAEFPPLMSLDAFRQNLPLQLTPLIGRRAEIAELVAALDDERLVTLTGSGGVGKTRLALAVGAELVGDFPGGVWFVELAGTRGTGSVGRATLKALGVPETPGVAPAEVAAVELGEGGRSLVILDNCEHLIDECAEFVVTVLGASADVSVLATSREQLGVAGEVAWRVPSLPSPPRDGPLPVEALSQYDAVNLFVDRARRARPSFTVNETTRPPIAQVCHRLDGIPLAVELAAARCRHMSIEQIASELDDRFRLLTGGSRMVMPRQQTLAASVEWSYELLDDVERRVLRRLGWFAGPFSLEAAEAVVAASGDVDPIAVFDTISRLVDKSLVLADDPDGASPYRLLETIRAFAVNRAREAGELTRLRDTHAAWWCVRLEGSGSPVRPTTSSHWSTPTTTISSPRCRGPPIATPSSVCACCGRWPGRSREPDGPATPCRRSTRCWHRPSSSNTPRRGCARPCPRRSRCSGSVARRPSSSCSPAASRGASASVTRYRVAIARWLLGMSVATDRELLRRGAAGDQPYAVRPGHRPAGHRRRPRRARDGTRGDAGRRRSRRRLPQPLHPRLRPRRPRHAGTGLR